MNRGYLIPKRSLVIDEPCPEKEISCEVISIGDDNFILRLEKGLMESVSLDTIYSFEYELSEERFLVEGRVLRRDNTSFGDIIIFNLIHGIYRL